MMNEEMERAISFLLENQARHDAETAELRGMIAETNRAVAETNRVVQMMAQSEAELDATMARAISDLAAAQQQTQAQLRETQA